MSNTVQEIRNASGKIAAGKQIHVLPEQIKLAFKINVKSPQFEESQAHGSATARGILAWAAANGVTPCLSLCLLGPQTGWLLPLRQGDKAGDPHTSSVPRSLLASRQTFKETLCGLDVSAGRFSPK